MSLTCYRTLPLASCTQSDNVCCESMPGANYVQGLCECFAPSSTRDESLQAKAVSTSPLETELRNLSSIKQGQEKKGSLRHSTDNLPTLPEHPEEVAIIFITQLRDQSLGSLDGALQDLGFSWLLRTGWFSRLLNTTTAIVSRTLIVVWQCINAPTLRFALEEINW